MYHRMTCFFICVLLVVSTYSDEANIIGTRAVDTSGNVYKLGFEKGLGPVAFVFLDTGCPISNRYAPQLNSIFDDSRSKGLSFYGIISDPYTSLTESSRFREKYKLRFPILFDSVGDLAEKLQPKTVPEAFVVNKQDIVAYRGRIDNRFSAVGKRSPKVTSHDLSEAIRSVAKTGMSSVKNTQAIGCIFEAWEGELEEVTYTRNIEPILRANCIECHQPQGIAPFSLTTYKDTKRRARMVSYVTRNRIMPPWRAKAGHGNFRDEHILGDRQIAMLKKWAKSGRKKGAPQDAMPEVKTTAQKWRLGKPDKVITMPQEFSVPAEGEDIYRYFVIPNVFQEDQIITGLDFRPGDPQVVHHVIYYADYSGKARKADDNDPKPGFSVFGTGGFMEANNEAYPLGGWAPGGAPYTLPPGYGIYLPKGQDIVLEIHYHLTGKATTDKSSLAVYFAKKPVDKFVDGIMMGTQNVDIPANKSDYWRHVSMEVPADMQLLDISPHMHYIGKEAKAVVTFPDGKKQSLLYVDDWDIRWQSNYVFREPVKIPAGSRIDTWFRYDNSADNAANPHSPPKNIKWGWQSNDEMCEMYFTIIAADKDKAKIQRAAYASWLRSADPNAQKSTMTTEEIIDKLTTVSSWSAKGEKVFEMALTSPQAEKIITLMSQRASKSNSANIYSNYGALLAIMMFYSTDESEQYALWMEADKAFNKALKLDPTHWDTRLSKAVIYIYSEDSGLQKQAQKLLLDLQAKNNNSDARYAKVYLYLGNLYELQGKKAAAQKTWKQGLQLYPKDEELQKKAAYR
ncbi:redoxin domain-containing protein [Candidatus Uabimicrobium amorphum]|uniref:Thioredoxin family protein n=1 Tax=Uabimicrobium amorphum TaxID=2596890 RepID=A0A5S9INC6_UABAM|nr:redoxin domain-containing protein [Candidatus Uabimicrobium amorphum]BBM83725.1 thioredoxin family protein [Candidatus Uabimicrobium amorphum]